ncbi:helix-turn-helix domain-containing protein [Limimonas halophila]|uniref:helix-turn-helix domain-containing protein n=1 Tax=Limimonas halophila TaxID=1082479 RepID=UPI000B7D5FA0|nr:helix-turn-helix transcriptional regulator [Limimonas halophila]
MITPEQCRAARGLLKWTQPQLARMARVSKDTVRHFESGRQEAHPSTLTVIQQAFEAHGVEFTNGDAPGVRLPKSNQSSS